MIVKLKKKIGIIALLTIASVSFTGCSVMMAASGKKEPNLNVVRKESQKFQIDSELGIPETIKYLDNGNVEYTYKYYVGAEPNVGRAAVWLVADLFLCFIPELITTPYEAAKGEKKYIKVIYDKDENFVKATI